MRSKNRHISSKKVTIGHTIYSFNEGGMERGILNLINYGNQEEFRHVIICFTEAGSYTELIRSADCQVVQLHKRNGNDWRVPWAIAEVVQQYCIHILHARGWPTLVETAIGAYLGRISATVYGFHGKTFEDLNGISLIRRLVQRTVIRSYDRVITLTPQMQAEVASECGLSKETIDLVPNGVDVHRFCPNKDRIKLCDGFGIPTDRFVVGNVGRLDAVKNQKAILRSLKELKSRGTIPYFVLVGDGPERQKLENQAQELGLVQDVKFVGYTYKVPDLMNCMDIYIQPSYYEGSSNTIVEAMACGLPVLATRVGGTCDLIDAGREGFFFEPEDYESLAALITQLQNNRILLQETGKRARQRVTNNCSVERTVALYENIYTELHSSNYSGRLEWSTH